MSKQHKTMPFNVTALEASILHDYLRPTNSLKLIENEQISFTQEAEDRWVVRNNRNPSVWWADGTTLPEALGNLIILHGEKFGFSLVIPKK